MATIGRQEPTAGCSYEGTLGKGGTSSLWKMVEGEGILELEPRMPSPYPLKAVNQAVPNPTSMIPKQSKKQQKNGFIF